VDAAEVAVVDPAEAQQENAQVGMGRPMTVNGVLDVMGGAEVEVAAHFENAELRVGVSVGSRGEVVVLGIGLNGVQAGALDSAARGREAGSGPRTSIASSTNSPGAMAATGERAPAATMTADREKDPDDGWPEKSPHAMSERPCPTNSWLLSSRSPQTRPPDLSAEAPSGRVRPIIFREERGKSDDRPRSME